MVTAVWIRVKEGGCVAKKGVMWLSKEIYVAHQRNMWLSQRNLFRYGEFVAKPR